MSQERPAFQSPGVPGSESLAGLSPLSSPLSPLPAVAFSSPFVPAEWIAAHGFQPHRLRLFAAERLTRGVCPYAGALLDAALRRNGPGHRNAHPQSQKLPIPHPRSVGIDNRLRSDAVRCRDAGSSRPRSGVSVERAFHVADARRARLYRDELRRLGRFLVRLGGHRPNDADLSRTMLDFERAREEQEGSRIGDGGGGIRPSMGTDAGHPIPNPQPPLAVPLAVVGGPLMETDGQFPFFELVARAGGCVVLDATEGGQRTLPRPFDRGRVASDPFGELADAYFDGIPDAFRGPTRRSMSGSAGRWPPAAHAGVILRRYLWCDLWHAECQRLKQWSPVPVLEIDIGPDNDAAPNRVQGRLEAFLETL